MPNNVRNILKFSGSQEDIDTFVNFIKSDKSLFDFEKLLPMPDTVWLHDWCVTNWGTKWNAYDVEFKDNAFIFNTAWDIPIPIYEKIAEQFSNLCLEIYYASEDIGYNCGELLIKNGNLEVIKEFNNGSYEAYSWSLFVWERDCNYVKDGLYDCYSECDDYEEFLSTEYNNINWLKENLYATKAAYLCQNDPCFVINKEEFGNIVWNDNVCLKWNGETFVNEFSNDAPVNYSGTDIENTIKEIICAL
jgi:hypothetical protein